MTNNRFNRFSPSAIIDENVLSNVALPKLSGRERPGLAYLAMKAPKKKKSRSNQVTKQPDYTDEQKRGVIEVKKQINKIPDNRYYNPDGSKKSVADITIGFARDEAAQRAYSEKNKVMNFAKFAEAIAKSRPDKNGFITLDKKTIGRLPAIIPGFTGINNPKEIKARIENGYVKIYGDGKPIKGASPRVDVVQEFARVGSVFNDNELNNFASATGSGASNKNDGISGKLSDRQKETLKLAQKEIEYNRKKLDELRSMQVDANNPEVVNAARNLVAAEKAARMIITPPENNRKQGVDYNLSLFDVANKNNQQSINNRPRYDEIVKIPEQQSNEIQQNSGMRTPPSLLDATGLRNMLPKGRGLDSEQLNNMSPENRAALLYYLNNR